MAVFVNEGQIADVFGPGLYTLTTHTLPILTYLRNWDKAFKSPFKSDVYYFSTRLQINQKWGTTTPITIRDKEFGAVRMRAYGIYSYRIQDPKIFYEKISGTREMYQVSDLDGQLRNTIVGQHDRRLRQQRHLLSGHGGRPAAVRHQYDGRSQAGLRRSRPGAGQLRGGKYLAARRIAEAARSAHRHEYGGRHGPLHAVPGGASHAHRRRQRRRWSRRRGRWLGSRPGDGAADDGRHAVRPPPGPLLPRQWPGRTSRTGGRRRHQILHRVAASPSPARRISARSAAARNSKRPPCRPKRKPRSSPVPGARQTCSSTPPRVE